MDVCLTFLLFNFLKELSKAYLLILLLLLLYQVKVVSLNLIQLLLCTILLMHNLKLILQRSLLILNFVPIFITSIIKIFHPNFKSNIIIKTFLIIKKEFAASPSFAIISYLLYISVIITFDRAIF